MSNSLRLKETGGVLRSRESQMKLEQLKAEDALERQERQKMKRDIRAHAAHSRREQWLDDIMKNEEFASSKITKVQLITVCPYSL